MTDIAQKISVVIRKRPLGKKEIAKKEEDIVDVYPDQSVIVREVKFKVDLTKYIEEHNYNFDLAFGEASNNNTVYLSAVRPIVEAAFNKARVTCFAYGQTGSGKTYTMLGDPDKGVPGMYLLAAQDIFENVQQPGYSQLNINVSFFEIYCGKLFDLLNKRSEVVVREDAKGNVNLINLQDRKVTNVQSLMQLIVQGQQGRVTSANSSNTESSRSHAILQIVLKAGKQVHGKMSFIDLAGSERGADVQDQSKQTRIDGAEINKSLLALKECIRALDLNKNHTPFRGSKLTQVLKDSLTGNCKTVMIGNISPSSGSSEHTLNTLRYADRVKELKKPQSQADYQQRELGLARQSNNITRKAFKIESEDEDDQDSNSFIGSTSNNQSNNNYQSVNSNNYQPMNNNSTFQFPQQQQQQINYQQPPQQIQQQQYQQQIPQVNQQLLQQQQQQQLNNNRGSINRFNLQQIPPISQNSGQYSYLQQQQQYNQYPQQSDQSTILAQQNSYNSTRSNTTQQLFQQYQQPPLFPNNDCNYQNQNQPDNRQQQQSTILEEETCFRNNDCKGMTARASNDSYIFNGPLREHNYNQAQNYNQQPNFLAQQHYNLVCQQLVTDHKYQIDKIIEISKEEMGLITEFDLQKDMGSYLHRLQIKLQHKLETIQYMMTKVSTASQEYQNYQHNQQRFPPNQHALNFFHEELLLNNDDFMI